MKLERQPTLADTVFDLRSRKIKNDFFIQINKLINWNEIEKLIDIDYCKGKSIVGKPSYSGLLLFKMCLLQSWYGLSDYGLATKFVTIFVKPLFYFYFLIFVPFLMELYTLSKNVIFLCYTS